MYKPFYQTSLLSALAVLAFTSCARDGYDDDERFLSSVQGAALLSPSADDIVITPSADGSTQTISWPVVKGAGGYELRLFNTADESIIVSDTVDGCSLTLPREEDMNYRLELRTMGNEKMRNTAAATATAKEFTTFTATYASIPAGDLYEWFQQNPISDTVAVSRELNYDLEPGGKYTLSAPLGFDFHKVVLRTSNKNDRATIALGQDANFVVYNDLTLKYIDIDASATTKAVMEAYNYTEEPGTDIIPKPGNYLLIDFVRLQECSLKGVKGSLFYDNNKSWAIVNFLIKNSIIEMNTAASSVRNEAFISFQGGGIKNFTISGSTVYQTSDENSKYFMRYHNSVRVDRMGYDTSDHTTLTYTNNTFYRVASGQWANYSGISNYSAYNLQSNIWVDCADGQIARRVMGNGRMGNGSIATWGNNTYWNNGEAVDNSSYDTGYILATDPAFADAANANFTPTGAEQVARQTGDPRWLN